MVINSITPYQMSEKELNTLARIARNNPDCFLLQKELQKVLGHIKYSQTLLNNQTQSCDDTCIINNLLLGKIA